MSKKLIAGAGVVASFAIALAPLATFANVAANPSDQHTDELVVTLLPSCTFGDWAQSTSPLPGGITHTGTDSDTTWTTAADGTVPTGIDDHTSNTLGDGAYEDTASTGYGIIDGEGANTSSNLNASEHTAYRTMSAGTATADFARTQMKVVCTNEEGYTVKVATDDLTYRGSDTFTNNTIPATNGFDVAGANAGKQSGYNLVAITSDGSASNADVKVSANYANANSAATIIEHTGVSAESGDTIGVTYGVSIKGSQHAGTYSGKVVYTLFQGLAPAQQGGGGA